MKYSTGSVIAGMRCQNSDVSRCFASRAELCSALGEVEIGHDGIFQRAARRVFPLCWPIDATLTQIRPPGKPARAGPAAGFRRRLRDWRVSTAVQSRRRLGTDRRAVSHAFRSHATDWHPVRIRVPKAFKRSFTADSSEHGAKVGPQRIEPPFLRLPGFRLCYEGTADDAAGLVPFYCYLCALPSKPGDADKLAAELATQLNDKFKDAKAEWEPIDAYSPDGKAKAWKKIRITGEQDFFVNTGQKEEVKKLPGIFELWMCNAPDWIVLVGWRTPTSIDGAPPPPDPKAKGVTNIQSAPIFRRRSRACRLWPPGRS